MTSINASHQHLQSTQKTTLIPKQRNRETKDFKEYLELQSPNTTADLKEDHYSVFGHLYPEKKQTHSPLHLPPDSAQEGLKKVFEQLNKMDKGKIILDIVTKVRVENGFKANTSSGDYNSKVIDFFNREDFSYVQFADELIENWKQSKPYNSFETYQNRLNTYVEFKNALIAHGVN